MAYKARDNHKLIFKKHYKNKIKTTNTCECKAYGNV